MPTISEPPLRGATHWPPSAMQLAEHFAAIVADLAERGIRPTPLGILAYATDCGCPDAIASQLADMVAQGAGISPQAHARPTAATSARHT